MEPPWSVFPDEPRGSISWRMGSGEETYDTFYKAFLVMSAEARASFALANPEPPGWQGFYAMISENPWLEI
ncbi:hypothetical protein U1839_17205 [Sphingomonas sp. RT2P30]|uniref:hypothetical protein n=1 Tax=Parasphingomonas halimpatiens TaxID=3096162 RepID=UPI002FCC21D6